MNKTTHRHFGTVDFALLITVVIWAANFTVVKIVLENLAPMVFGAIRFAIATVVLMGIIKVSGQGWRVDRHEAWRLIVLGLIGNTVYQFLFINGVALTSAGNSALMLGGVPMYVSLIGAALGLERLSRRAWFGCLLAFSGIVLIVIGSGQAVDVGGKSLKGTFLVLLGAIAWSVYTVMSRPLLQRHSSLKVTGLAMCAGLPGIVVAAIPGWGTQQWQAVPRSGWLGLIFSAVLALCLGYVLWSFGVQKVGSARTAIYSNLTPVIATIVGWLWLGEPLSWLKVVGAAVIVCGVYLTRTGTAKLKSAPQNARPPSQ